MSAPGSPPAHLGGVVGGPWLLLTGVMVGFAALGTLPPAEAVAVAVVAAGLGTAARHVRSREVHPWAPIPPLVGIGVLAVFAVPSGLTALYGGVASLALLLWLADDPDRLPGGVARALVRLLVPAVGLGIAWTSAFLLPGDIVPLGAGVALLVAVVILAALLLRSPQGLERDAAASS